MQRRPDWLGRLLMPLLVINIAGVCKRTLASRCLVLIYSYYELLCSSVSVHGEHPAWIAVCVRTPGLTLVSVDSEQHISLLFPLGQPHFSMSADASPRLMTEVVENGYTLFILCFVLNLKSNLPLKICRLILV